MREIGQTEYWDFIQIITIEVWELHPRLGYEPSQITNA